MTMGHMLETYFAHINNSYDASPFIQHNIPNNTTCTLPMYIPGTSKQMIGEVFYGTCFYISLKHKSEDKFFMRSKGDVDFLTRQPPEGKKNKGGLRLGNMEIDSLLVHEATKALQYTLFDNNDLTTISWCLQCKELFLDNKICTHEIEVIEVSTGFILLVQYLRGCGISLNLVF